MCRLNNFNHATQAARSPVFRSHKDVACSARTLAEKDGIYIQIAPPPLFALLRLLWSVNYASVS